MKTVKELIREKAAECTESILDCSTFDKREITEIISTHMSMAVMEVSRCKIINYNNTIKQLTQTLETPTTSASEKERVKIKIKELNALAGKSSTLIAETVREHKYHKMRAFLKVKGLTDLLEEFDKNNPTDI